MAETPIRLGLPLPLDVVISLTNAIGAMYPSAKIKTNSGYEEMVIVIDDDQRRPRVGKKKLAAAKNTSEDPANEQDVLAWDDDHLVTSTPEELSLYLGGACAHLLASNESAVNYMEMQVTYKGKPYVVAACRSKGQTPHALRMKAEQERDAALAEVERLRAELVEMRGA
jgi:hypothetical protein